MDLIPRRIRPFRRLAAAGALAALLAGGCSSGDAPFELTENAIALPATLKEALRLANSLALEVSDRAYVSKMGGGFTLMNEEGRARHHSFVFHAREGIGVTRRITIHMIGGTVWMFDEGTSGPPPPFNDVDDLADSDAAVAAALDWAMEANGANPVRPDSVPVPPISDEDGAFNYAAKILSVAQWPEPNTLPDSPRLAWRVDFLTERVAGGGSVPVPFSVARFYFDPVTLERFGAPIVNTELYPRP